MTSTTPIVTVFTANPSTLTPLELERELEAVQAELDAAGLAEILYFDCRRDTTPNEVQRALLMSRPTVVQFSAHGRGPNDARARDFVVDTESREPAGIMLRGDDDMAVKVVSGEALDHLFARVRSNVRLVFLNACHSIAQADAILGHVDFVIGMDGAITDEGARVFSVALYRALASGHTIKESHELGVNALVLEGLEADQQLPVLRTRRGADPRAATLVDAPPADDGHAWDVYLAYAQADRELVQPLATALRERHLRVFFDEWELLAGDRKGRRLEGGVEGSLNGLIAFSAQTMAEPWVEEQYAALLEQAVTEGRRLIPVLIGQGGAKLPPFLRARQCVDLREGAPSFRRGIESITRAIRGQQPGPPRRRPR